MVVHTLLLALVIGAIVLQSDRVITQRLNYALNTDLGDEVTEFTAVSSARPVGEDITGFTQKYLENHARSRTLLLVVYFATPRPNVGQYGAAGS